MHKIKKYKKFEKCGSIFKGMTDFYIILLKFTSGKKSLNLMINYIEKNLIDFSLFFIFNKIYQFKNLK
jgi:hypothetical protein